MSTKLHHPGFSLVKLMGVGSCMVLFLSLSNIVILSEYVR